MSDAEIIQAVKSGQYYETVKKLHAYFPVVKKFIQKNSGNRQDAEDIFQDALMILLNRLKADDFVLKSSLNTFLFGVCRNLWMEQLRKKSREMLTDDFQREEAESAGLHSAIEENQSRNKAMNAFMQLGEKCRQILELFYHGKKSMQEIAKIVGFAGENGAKNQKYRCIEKAREIYLKMN